VTTRRPLHFHLLGMGGIGMSGLALLLKQKGHEVSGCDCTHNSLLDTLTNSGISYHLQHSPEHLTAVDAIAYSSALSQDEPEISHANMLHLTQWQRARLLAEVINDRHIVMVTGTHGKSTTTAWIAWILHCANMQPGYYIGATSPHFSQHAELGEGHFILEADESDNTLNAYQPNIMLLTNLEPDHLENYDNNFEHLKTAVKQSIEALPADGLLIFNGDDKTLTECANMAPCQTLSFGLHPSNDFSLFDIRYTDSVYAKVQQLPQEDWHLPFSSQLFGRHNLYNCLATITLAKYLSIPDDVISEAIASFSGVDRRCDIMQNIPLSGKKVTVISDYGHHPKAISALHQALSCQYPGKRLVWVFQPHRYTRTQALFDGFIEALSKIQHLFLLEVYAASETVIEGATSSDLALALPHTVPVCDTLSIFDALQAFLQEDDILVFQGAGDILHCIEKIQKLVNTTCSEIV